MASAGDRGERTLAWMLIAPAVGAVVLVAMVPLVWTLWESLHTHDLRMPWLGRPFVGLENYRALASDPRFWGALAHTVFFVAVTVAIELVLGLALALGLDRIRRGSGWARIVVLLPWAVPTVVAALVWRFIFEGDTGIANAFLTGSGILDEPVAWFVGASSAWVPIVLADVWKTTPFVALILLAGLQGIPDDLYEAARIDGAGPWQRLRGVTLPLLAPALAVAVLFRALDGFRVFDLIYVLTSGGPGTATEPLSLYAFQQLLQNLRFGYGSALSMTVFIGAFLLALVWLSFTRRSVLGGPE